MPTLTYKALLAWLLPNLSGSTRWGKHLLAFRNPCLHAQNHDSSTRVAKGCTDLKTLAKNKALNQDWILRVYTCWYYNVSSVEQQDQIVSCVTHKNNTLSVTDLVRQGCKSGEFQVVLMIGVMGTSCKEHTDKLSLRSRTEIGHNKMKTKLIQTNALLYQSTFSI